MKIYHNPRCSKSRQTLGLLQSKGKNPEVIEYLKNPPSFEELKEIISLLKIKPLDLIRKKETKFSAYKRKELSDDEWIKVMIKHPKLIERPIVVVENEAVISRPPEKVLELFN